MVFIEGVFFNIIFLMFPILIYLIYVAYKANINKKEKAIILDFTIFTSLYLIMRFGVLKEDYVYFNILFNIPLLISYLRKRKLTAIILSIMIVFYQVVVLEFNGYFIIFEYLMYFALYAYINRNHLTYSFLVNSFMILKTIIFSFYYFLFLYDCSFISSMCTLVSTVFLFYSINYLIFYLLEKGEEIINLNNTLKELEKEKTLRNSIFKITHEIKNPIAVCKGYLDMLDPNDSKKVNKYIPIIKSEISRTISLMDDFLDYTRIKINKEILDINILCEDVYNSLTILFNKNNASVILKMYDDELYIEGDYNRLKQVLVNILKNSLEARKDDEVLSINFKIKKTANNVLIIIKDTGIGMSEETLSHLDEMFYTTKVKGTGLGVKLSKEIVKLHQGSLTYESKFGKGCQATIMLPLYKKSS